MPQSHVGYGVAIIDPQIIEDNNWNTGQILELSANKKNHVKLWSGFPEDRNSGIIRIDGLTRYNIGASIGEKVTINGVKRVDAEQIVLSPTEKIHAEGLHVNCQCSQRIRHTSMHFTDYTSGKKYRNDSLESEFYWKTLSEIFADYCNHPESKQVVLILTNSRLNVDDVVIWLFQHDNHSKQQQ